VTRWRPAASFVPLTTIVLPAWFVFDGQEAEPAGMRNREYRIVAIAWILSGVNSVSH
jgi:hypothetical protein